jgi:putative two-component system response regulator
MSKTHNSRTARVSLALGRVLGLNDAAQAALRACAVLHDAGKSLVPETIWSKPGPLDPLEREIMKAHTWMGAGVLSADYHQEKAAVVALTHHERWDGRGYPYGLSGREIPLFSRIVTLADVYDALRSRRPYKPPFPLHDTLDICRCERGRLFDPFLLDVFLEHLPVIRSVQ